MDISPRLTQILFLLVNADAPIPAGKLAEHLKISRRTVFRELEYINRTLQNYQLEMKTKSLQGLWIEGTSCAKQNFKNILEKSASFDPKNREERQETLLLELLARDAPEKLYYYANLLKVSESTISNDLPSIEKELSKNGIQLHRKPGYGIYLSYEEINYRKTLLHHLIPNEANRFFYQLHEPKSYAGIVDKAVIHQIIEILENTQNQIFLQMTQESYIALILYLSIAAIRLQKKKVLALQTVVNTPESPNRFLAHHLADQIAQKFQIDLSEQERYQILIYLNSAKLQAPHADRRPLHTDEAIRNLVYEMMQAYDLLQAFDFKQDDAFMEGMIAHLSPTIVRLKNHIEIKNPFLPQIKAMYSDIYCKSKAAAKVLSKHISCDIPDDEIGFLALHFGAASVRRRRKQERFKANVGVICASGIGISRLLLSRLTHLFQDKISATIFAEPDLTPDALETIDFLIATYPLENIEKPLLCVHPLLNDSDIEKIMEQIRRCCAKKQDCIKHKTEADNANESLFITDEIQSILSSFQIHRLASASSFTTAVETAALTLGTDLAAQKQIAHDLTEREKLSTQVIPEFEIALLHARTSSVKDSKLLLFLPSGPTFTSAVFTGIRAIIVMLIPKQTSRRTLAISSVSGALFDDGAFLSIMKSGDEEQIRRSIQSILEQYLLQYLKSIYET